MTDTNGTKNATQNATQTGAQNGAQNATQTGAQTGAQNATQTGVDVPSAPSSGANGTSTPDAFALASRISDIPDDGALGVEVEGEPVCLVRVGGEVFALRDVCSHAEVPLSEGEIYDHTVECWLHGSCFDVRTGQPTGPPATEPVPVYPVKIDGDDIYVAITASKES